MIWKHPVNLEFINNTSKNTLASNLGIEITNFGDDFLEATMPVDERTKQPYGLLHGGASVSLAETVGSLASSLCIEDFNTQSVVGLEINANHIRSATSGKVTAVCKPIKIGRNIHVWNIEIHNDVKKLVCVSRLTMAVVPKR